MKKLQVILMFGLVMAGGQVYGSNRSTSSCDGSKRVYPTCDGIKTMYSRSDNDKPTPDHDRLRVMSQEDWNRFHNIYTSKITAAAKNEQSVHLNSMEVICLDSDLHLLGKCTCRNHYSVDFQNKNDEIESLRCNLGRARLENSFYKWIAVTSVITTVLAVHIGLKKNK